MMKQNNTILSNIGLSNYYITPQGKVFVAATDKEIQKGKTSRFYLIDDNGTEHNGILR